MNRSVGVLWHQPPPDWVQPTMLNILESHPEVQIIFRADDIAEVDERFCLLMGLFLHHRVPLCLAVVPDWLTRRRWEKMQQFDTNDRLWCWHQHGFAHVNHQKTGKKCEFADNRGEKALFNDIRQGREHLSTLLGNSFYPVFTPPWNRCGQITLTILQDLGFSGVSRYHQAKPQPPGGLQDIAMHIDLHTGRASDQEQGWKKVVSDCSRAAATGTIGIMIHHQRMNPAAFQFLDNLLLLIRDAGSSTCTFREQLGSPRTLPD